MREPRAVALSPSPATPQREMGAVRTLIAALRPGPICGELALAVGTMAHAAGLDSPEQWGLLYHRCGRCGQAFDCTDREQADSEAPDECWNCGAPYAADSLRLSEGWVEHIRASVPLYAGAPPEPQGQDVSAPPHSVEGSILRLPEPWPSIWHAEIILRCLVSAWSHAAERPVIDKAERVRLILNRQLNAVLEDGAASRATDGRPTYEELAACVREVVRGGEWDGMDFAVDATAFRRACDLNARISAPPAEVAHA